MVPRNETRRVQIKLPRARACREAKRGRHDRRTRKTSGRLDGRLARERGERLQRAYEGEKSPGLMTGLKIYATGQTRVRSMFIPSGMPGPESTVAG